MHSIRTKFTLLTVCVIVIAVTTVSLLSVLFITRNEHREADQMLLLLCETGERNLDYYFNSVQSSVGKVATFVEEDLDGLEDEKLEAHIRRVGKYFEEMANKTNGVLTYYYRIDPEISDTVKGFWFTDLDGNGFEEHQVTDITLYDMEDTSKLVWFTVPKHTGRSIWQPPYITDNLDVRVISYNVPIYYGDTFVGVVGIEIDYSTMAGQVESIRFYNNGYAFLNDAEGNLIYHPRMDVASMTAETAPQVPEGLVSNDTFLRYRFDGVEKRAAWLPLSNGMRLNVSVPVSETDGNWQGLVREILVASAIVLFVLSVVTLYITSHITKPLETLTKAAEQADKGNYDFPLEYDKNDEVGRLTETFRRMAGHMRDHISDLNKRAYVDALTSVKNKGAFASAVEELQIQVEDSDHQMAFAVGVFDCDDLKKINDQFGHDKGDIYLKTASRLICRVFQHSPVYRVGGDEFSVILQNEDFENREALIEKFEQDRQALCASTENKWEQVKVAVGVAVYDPGTDTYVNDTVRRADKIMYMNKRQGKEARKR